MEIDYQSRLKTLDAKAKQLRFNSRDLLLVALQDIRKREIVEIEIATNIVVMVQFSKLNGMIDKGIFKCFYFKDEGYGIFCRILATDNVTWDCPLNKVKFECVEGEISVTEFLVKIINN